MKLPYPALLLLMGCIGGVGNGAVNPQLRDVPFFNGVAIQTGLNARLTIGPRSLVLKTDENLQDLIEAEVQNRVLILRKRRDALFAPTSFEAIISLPLIVSVDGSGGARLSGEVRTAGTFQLVVSGGSEVNLSGLETRFFRADASGESRVLITGTAEEETVIVSGSSRMAIDGAPAQNISLNFRGASVGRVHALDAVHGQLSDGSHVAVFGNPGVREVAVSGGSSVTF